MFTLEYVALIEGEACLSPQPHLLCNNVKQNLCSRETQQQPLDVEQISIMSLIQLCSTFLFVDIFHSYPSYMSLHSPFKKTSR